MGNIYLTPQAHVLTGGAQIHERKHVVVHKLHYFDPLVNRQINQKYEVSVPTEYDGTIPVPVLLTISTQSADVTNMEKYAWALVGERENFLTVVTYRMSSGREKNMRSMPFPGEPVEEEDNMLYLDKVLEDVQKRYCVDSTRIYLHGLSAGDLMASRYAFERGNRLAAAALMSGPPHPNNLYDENGEFLPQLETGAPRKPQDALPVVRYHGTLDNISKWSAPSVTDRLQGHILKLDTECVPNNLLWMQVNGCSQEPEILLDGRINLLYYRGEKADYLYYVLEDGLHHHDLADADFIWRIFLSRYRRVDGQVVCENHNLGYLTDEDTVAVTDGSDQAYIRNKVVQLHCGRVRVFGNPDINYFVNGSEKVVPKVTYVPVRFFEEVWPGTQVLVEPDGRGAVITYGDREVKLAYGNRCLIANNRVINCGAVEFDEEQNTLLAPLKEVARQLYGYFTYERLDAAYLSKRKGCILTIDTAYILQNILGTRRYLSSREIYRLCVDSHAAYREETASWKTLMKGWSHPIIGTASLREE